MVWVFYRVANAIKAKIQARSEGVSQMHLWFVGRAHGVTVFWGGWFLVAYSSDSQRCLPNMFSGRRLDSVCSLVPKRGMLKYMYLAHCGHAL